MSQDEIQPITRSQILVSLSITFIILLLAYLGLIPFHPGCMFAALAFVGNLLHFYAAWRHSTINMHFINLVYALAPIWVLVLDPCALAFAQSLTAMNVCFTAIEQKREKKVRATYTALMIFGWLFVFVGKGTIIKECEDSVTTNLRRDIVMILVVSVLLMVACIVLIDSHLKATNDALAQVKELNSKFESLNRELKQLLDDKDSFILLFSHETRNPLNILLGNLSLLLEEADAPNIKNKLIRCKFCADLLLQHLNNILDTGKLANKGTLEVTLTPVRVYEYLQSTASFMEMLVKKKSSLKPELMIPEKLPAMLKFDMQRLTQVILNILTNAVKFTDSGSITMVIRYLKKSHIEESDYYPTTALGYQLLNKTNSPEIECLSEFCENPMGSGIQLSEHFRREIGSMADKKDSFLGSTSEDGFLKIEVSDTGCGMKEEDLNKLFQKFSQVHSEGTKSALGTGLGLWITKTLCKLMNGDIRVYSKPKVGTCFSAIIQANSVQAHPRVYLKPQISPTITTSPILMRRRDRRVLLADDDPYNLDFHIHIMKELGFDAIETAVNGQDLLTKFKSKPEGFFEAVITDVSMPQLNGIQAASKIREFESLQNRSFKVKIGFITGHSNPNDKAICENEPISSLFYLSKPIKACMLESFLDFKRSFSPTENRKISLTLNDNSPERECPLILCVDDDIFNLDCVSEMLESLGAKTIKATSGEEGLSLFKKILLDKGPQLSFVLMDCRMSGMDGWTATQQMKEILRVQNRSDVPIIGLTGEEKEHNKQKFSSSGMEDMLQKPITKARLERLLKNYSSSRSTSLISLKKSFI